MRHWSKRKPFVLLQGVLYGSSTWARTRDLRINRKPGSSKTYINQWLTCTFDNRLIFRVINKKLHNATFRAKQANLGLVHAIYRSGFADLRFQESKDFSHSQLFKLADGRLSLVWLIFKINVTHFWLHSQPEMIEKLIGANAFHGSNSISLKNCWNATKQP